MEGDALISQLADATGLPKAWVEDELRGLLQKRGLNPAQFTMEHLREVLAEFLQETLLQAKSSTRPIFSVRIRRQPRRILTKGRVADLLKLLVAGPGKKARCHL